MVGILTILGLSLESLKSSRIKSDINFFILYLYLFYLCIENVQHKLILQESLW